MINFYDFILSTPQFNKLHLKDVVFAEYTCPIDAASLSIWTPNDYIVHVLSGTKTWHTTKEVKTARKGDTLYIKKGAHVVHQSFDEPFCVLMFFMNDAFKKQLLMELNPSVFIKNKIAADHSAVLIEIENDLLLQHFFQSVFAYFHYPPSPSALLLETKYKELIYTLLQNPKNQHLAAHIFAVESDHITQLQEVMENNFCYNLSLEAFAKLCNRSVSSFKRDFKKAYNDSPGRWLLAKRLEYAAAMLQQTDFAVIQVAQECGFEDASHFTKAFKTKFKVSPKAYRQSFH